MRGWTMLAVGFVLVALTAPSAIRRRSVRDGFAALVGGLLIVGSLGYF